MRVKIEYIISVKLSHNKKMEVDFRKMLTEQNNAKYAQTDTSEYGVCCSTPMDVAGGTYVCSICNNTCGFEIQKTSSAQNRVFIKVGASGRYYNTPQDTEIMQRESIHDQLMSKQAQYTGYKLSPNVLITVVNQYSQIQQHILKRGSFKDEILAALIYHECINQGNEHRRKDITKFMQLKNGGFSRGEGELRDLVNKKLVDVVFKGETALGYAERYLELLELRFMGISNYLDFILEIIEVADEKVMGNGSQVSSKVIGTLWFLIVKKKYKISRLELEKECDQTKGNTILKFYDVIISNRDVFYETMKRHDVY